MVNFFIEITLRVEKVILSEIICYFAKGFSFAKSETEVVIFSLSLRALNLNQVSQPKS